MVQRIIISENSTLRHVADTVKGIEDMSMMRSKVRLEQGIKVIYIRERKFIEACKDFFNDTLDYFSGNNDHQKQRAKDVCDSLGSAIDNPNVANRMLMKVKREINRSGTFDGNYLGNCIKSEAKIIAPPESESLKNKSLESQSPKPESEGYRFHLMQMKAEDIEGGHRINLANIDCNMDPRLNLNESMVVLIDFISLHDGAIVIEVPSLDVNLYPGKSTDDLDDIKNDFVSKFLKAGIEGMDIASKENRPMAITFATEDKDMLKRIQAQYLQIINSPEIIQSFQ